MESLTNEASPRSRRPPVQSRRRPRPGSHEHDLQQYDMYLVYRDPLIATIEDHGDIADCCTSGRNCLRAAPRDRSGRAGGSSWSRDASSCRLADHHRRDRRHEPFAECSPTTATSTAWRDVDRRRSMRPCGLMGWYPALQMHRFAEALLGGSGWRSRNQGQVDQPLACWTHAVAGHECHCAGMHAGRQWTVTILALTEG